MRRLARNDLPGEVERIRAVVERDESVHFGGGESRWIVAIDAAGERAAAEELAFDREAHGKVGVAAARTLMRFGV